MRDQGIDTVTLAGYMPSNCDHASAADAETRDLAVEVLSDATGAIDLSNESRQICGAGPCQHQRRGLCDPGRLLTGSSLPRGERLPWPIAPKRFRLMSLQMFLDPHSASISVPRTSSSRMHVRRERGLRSGWSTTAGARGCAA
ncbi:hypothetical protein GCM10022377_02500 [Zhihengliuella alba]|uniref:Uncharacterized protein n=1 Tax=Zhihengliuella alba TaxID=547018 RepID=A0ABP7CSB0_9MICC